jgi:hypothetical protein
LKDRVPLPVIEHVRENCADNSERACSGKTGEEAADEHSLSILAYSNCKIEDAEHERRHEKGPFTAVQLA